MDASGVNGVNIFLEPSLHDTPELELSLQNLGATPVSTPKDADIIVVNQRTQAGRQLIRKWRDSGSVVLESPWIDKCRHAGHLLLSEDDNWAGCLILDDDFLDNDNERPAPVFSGSTNFHKPSFQPYPQFFQFQFPSSLGPLPPSFSGLTHDQLVQYAAGFPIQVLQLALQRRLQLEQEAAPPMTPRILSSDSNPSTTSKGKRKATSESEDSAPSKQASPPLPQIFSRQSGKSFTFFIQEDLSNHSKIVKLIGLYGGKVTRSNNEADYVILGTDSSSFKTLHEEISGLRKPCLSASFILDSIDNGSMVDPVKYECDPPPPANSQPTPVAKNSRRQTKPETGRVSAGATSRHIRSPTPPPESSRSQIGTNYLYTQADNDYAKRYVRVLFERDHTISAKKIADALYEKMPHHSAKSWAQHIRTKLDNDFETLRKRATIQYKKNLSTNPTPSEPAAQPSSTSHLTNQQKAEVDIFVNFFVHDEAQAGEGDEMRWQRLSAKVQCETADSWEDFYNSHIEAITSRFAEKVAELA